MTSLSRTTHILKGGRKYGGSRQRKGIENNSFPPPHNYLSEKNRRRLPNTGAGKKLYKSGPKSDVFPGKIWKGFQKGGSLWKGFRQFF